MNSHKRNEHLQSSAAVVLAVAHKEYYAFSVKQIKGLMGINPVLTDVKCIYDQQAVNIEAVNQVFNVAVNARTNLNQLFEFLRVGLAAGHPSLKTAPTSLS